VQLFKGNKLSLFNNFCKKERNARGADDLNPIETTHAAGRVTRASASTLEHRAEPDLQVRRPVGRQRPAAARRAVRARRQQLHPRLPRGLADRVQPTLIVIDRPEPPFGAQSVFIRPVNSQNYNANYSCPQTMGGDHAFFSVRRLLARRA
jgi:hypothetical protein